MTVMYEGKYDPKVAYEIIHQEEEIKNPNGRMWFRRVTEDNNGNPVFLFPEDLNFLENYKVGDAIVLIDHGNNHIEIKCGSHLGIYSEDVNGEEDASETQSD